MYTIVINKILFLLPGRDLSPYAYNLISIMNSLAMTSWNRVVVLVYFLQIDNRGRQQGKSAKSSNHFNPYFPLRFSPTSLALERLYQRIKRTIPWLRVLLMQNFMAIRLHSNLFLFFFRLKALLLAACRALWGFCEGHEMDRCVVAGVAECMIERFMR